MKLQNFKIPVSIEIHADGDFRWSSDLWGRVAIFHQWICHPQSRLASRKLGFEEGNSPNHRPFLLASKEMFEALLVFLAKAAVSYAANFGVIARMIGENALCVA